MESEHFRYHARSSDWVCPGLMDWLEHHLDAVGGFLRVELGPDEKIDYYKFPDEGDLTAHACPSNEGFVSGCAERGTAFSVRAYHPHELVHVYARRIGEPPLFFEEGLAEVLRGGQWSPDSPIDKTVEIDRYLETRAMRKVQGKKITKVYAVAAGFTRFLLEEYGRDAYLAFYRTTPHGAGLERIASEFERRFGDSLDEAIRSWREGPRQTSEGIRLHLASCSADRLDRGKNVVEGFECGDQVPPFTNLVSPLAWVGSFDSTEPVGLKARVRVEEQAAIEVRSCDSELLPIRNVLNRPVEETSLWTDLRPGDYWLAARQWSDPAEAAASDARIQVEIDSPLFAPVCRDAEEQRVRPGTRELRLRGSTSPEGSRQFLRFQVPEPRRMTIRGVRNSESEDTYRGATEFTVCRGGCADAGGRCTEHRLPVEEPFDLDANVPYVLVIEDREGTGELWLDLRFSNR